MADRIVVLNHGRVAQDATPVQIYQHPANAYVARMFGSFNEFHRQVEHQRVETPLGTIACTDFENGSNVLVMTRSTDIHVTKSESNQPTSSITATVCSSRLLGPTTLLKLKTTKGATASNLVNAQIPGIHLMKPGTEVNLTIEPEAIFVFSTADPAEE